MVLFWIAALLMVAAALAFVLPPLWFGNARGGVARDRLNVALYRDRRAELEAELADGSLSEEDFARAEAELQRDLLFNVEGNGQPASTGGSSRWVVWPVALAVPILAVGVYLAIGAPEMADAERRAVAEAAATQQQMDGALAALEAKLEQEPNNPEGWLLLGRSLLATGEYRHAADVFAKGMQAVGERSDLLLGRAQALALINGNDLSGEPMALVNRVLEREPANTEALWFVGVNEFQNGDYGAALETWRGVRAQVEEGSELAQIVDEAIADAEASLGGTAESGSAAGGAAAVLTVRVALAPELSGQLPGSAVLYVFARSPGSKMPVAVKRYDAGEIPLEVRLDDSSSMSGGSLATMGELEIVARVSRSGSVTAASGDFEGSATARAGDSIDLTIDRVIP